MHNIIWTPTAWSRRIDAANRLVYSADAQKNIVIFSCRGHYEEERALADSYAKLHAMSLGEAFKRALFEKIEDEYDIRVAEEAHEAYVKSGKKRRPIEELWKETGL